MHVKGDTYSQFNDHENVGGPYKNNVMSWSRNRSQIIYGIVPAPWYDFITQPVHLILAAVHSGLPH